MISRVMILVAALLAALAAIPRLALIAQMVAWAFSMAASSFFPVILLGIFWRRANANGAIAGMIAGMIACIIYMALTTRTRTSRARAHPPLGGDLRDDRELRVSDRRQPGHGAAAEAHPGYGRRPTHARRRDGRATIRDSSSGGRPATAPSPAVGGSK